MEGIMSGKKRYIVILVGVVFAPLLIFLDQANGDYLLVPTPTPTVFQFPAAPPPEEILPVVLSLMEFNEDCLLPCFWSFHPGETQMDEIGYFVVDSFQQIPYVSPATNRSEIADVGLGDPSIRDIDFHSTFLPLSSEGGSLEVRFGSIDGLLVRTYVDMFISANWLDSNPFLLSEILSVYGEPTQVYLRYGGAPTLAYILVIVYEDRGFIVEYSFGGNASADERITQERRLLICVEDPTYDSIQLILQPEDNPTPFIEMLQPTIGDQSAFRPFWAIEDMTGLTIEEFTEAFAGNPEACIEMYSLAELREQGY